MGEAELSEEGVDGGGDVGFFGDEEAGGEGEGLGDGEERERGVVLRDVGGEFSEGGRVYRGRVEEQAAVARGGSGGDDVEES